MTEITITATTNDGVADARLFRPSGDGPWPLVVFYPDAGGLRPAMSAMGERLAAAGYAVLQPNPFWRSGPYAPFDARTVFGDPKERQRLMALIATVRAEDVIADTVALAAAAAQTDTRVRTEQLGVVGYCMGGRIAFIAATVLPDRIVAAASIHAGGLVNDTPESPHRSAAKITAALYLGVADEDQSCTPEHQEALRSALDEAGVRYQLELNPGARHGYAVPDFPVYDEVAAERHWDRVLALFRRRLGVIRRPIAVEGVPWETFSEGSRFGSRFRHLTSAAIGNGYHVGVQIEELEPGRQTSPAHYHMLEEEHILMLEGRATLRLGEESYDFRAGDYVCFPAGQRAGHCLVNDGTETCRFIVIGEHEPNEVCVYTDSKKINVRSVGEIYDKTARRHYWHGEKTGK